MHAQRRFGHDFGFAVLIPIDVQIEDSWSASLSARNNEGFQCCTVSSER
jgi:hypothetical protein